jgi:hypothetical protein
MQRATHFAEVELYAACQIGELLSLKSGQAGHLLHEVRLQLA